MEYKLVCGELILGMRPRVEGRDTITYQFGSPPKMSSRLEEIFDGTLVPAEEWKQIRRIEFRMDQYLICFHKPPLEKRRRVVGIFLRMEDGWYQAQKLCKVEDGRLLSCTPTWYRPTLEVNQSPDDVGEVLEYKHGQVLIDRTGKGMFIKSIVVDIPAWTPTQVSINVEFPLADLIYYPTVCGFASRKLRV